MQRDIIRIYIWINKGRKLKITLRSEIGNTYDYYIFTNNLKDEVLEVAIKQIREKEYVEKFRCENEGEKILAVAICYDSESKEYSCKIEEI